MMNQKCLSYSQNCKNQAVAYIFQPMLKMITKEKMLKPNEEIVTLVESQPLKRFELSKDLSHQ